MYKDEIHKKHVICELRRQINNMTILLNPLTVASVEWLTMKNTKWFGTWPHLTLLCKRHIVWPLQTNNQILLKSFYPI